MHSDAGWCGASERQRRERKREVPSDRVGTRTHTRRMVAIMNKAQEIQEKLARLAIAIGRETEIVSYVDFCRFCITAGIGFDKRTAKNWLRVALAFKVLAYGPTPPKGRNGLLYCKGPNFEKYLHPSDNGGKQ